MFKPCDQNLIHDVTGDCLRACVASILGLEAPAVPNFAECGFMDGLKVWAEENNLHFLWMEIPGFVSLDKIWFGNVPERFIAWGESPRPTESGKPKQHAVVVSSKGYGVKIVHDPHPSRAGLKTIFGFAFLLGK